MRGAIITALCVLSVVVTVAPARADGALYGTFGIGTSHPFRPGNTTPATELGLRGALGALALEFTIHQEGGRMRNLEPTATVLRLAAAWRPSLGNTARTYARIGGGVFALADVEPRLGLNLDVGYGWRSPIGELGGFAQWQTPWYSEWSDSTVDALRYGTTAGAELTSGWRMLMAQARVGVVGGTEPYVMITAGAGWRWR